ncbi:MAG: plastocyanin/azurin family copper-binding protein [Verrucomicrobiota bacterium]
MNRLLLPLLIPVFFLLGCGDSAESPTHHHDHATPADTPAVSASPDDFIKTEGDVTTVMLTGNDTMKYNLEAFTVKAGSTVRIVFENQGKMPKAAMGHNVVVLKSGVDSTAFVTAAAKARETDYIPADLADQIIAYSKLLGPGETDTIEFQAPDPGAYEFVCSFPAHLYAGMVGVMTVE